MSTESQIYRYTDYREFLSDYHARKKSSNPSYSHRVFARQAGLSSPSHLLMIIKGQRNLSIRTLPKFCDALKLNARERRYFEILVQYNQARDLSGKSRFFAELVATKALLKGTHALEKEKFDFLSQWHAVAIYVLVDLKDFLPEPAWISRRLRRRISPAQAKEALESLEKIGLIALDPVRGYRQVSGAISVADDTRSAAVYRYHQSMLQLAAEAFRDLPSEAREYNGVTLALPRAKLPELKEKIRQFRKELNQLASSYPEPDELFQFNIQLFPITHSEEK